MRHTVSSTLLSASAHKLNMQEPFLRTTQHEQKGTGDGPVCDVSLLCTEKIFALGTILKGDKATGPLCDAGVSPGTTIRVVCSSQQRIDEIHAGDETLGKFDGFRGFDEEEELEWRRHEAEPMFAPPARGSIGNHGFSRIEPLQMDPLTAAPYTNPPPEEARKLLESLAADRGIQAIMQRRGWRVGLLTELPPNEETVRTPRVSFRDGPLDATHGLL